MQLRISNIGKIKEAIIDIDGITVIAGENNAGKSTIGKLLFAVFNAMNNMDEKIREEKRNKIYHIMIQLLQKYRGARPDEYTVRLRRDNIFAMNVANNIMGYISGDIKQDQDEVEVVLQRYSKDVSVFENSEDSEIFLEECVNKLKPILGIADDRIMEEVITRWFNRIFDGQVSPLWDEGAEAKV